jgi:glucan phosphoethanolaminetransferase (alkaline phosphatase superfamily)
MKETLKRFTFITVATLFIGIAFTSADFFTVPASGWKDSCILLFQWGVLMLALWPVIGLLAVNRWVFAVLYPLGCTLAAILTWFRYTTRTTFTTMILESALDNDISISMDLITPGLILTGLAALFVGFFFVRYRFRKIRMRRPFLHALVAIGMIAVLFHIQRITDPVAQRIPFNLYFVTYQYFSEKQTALTERKALPGRTTCPDDEAPIVVCVIGETLRADHLGLNGYSRSTTPLLSGEDVVSFTHIYSEYTYTNPSVAHILSPADSLHPEAAYTERSFVDLFKHCGYYSAWIANQTRAKSYAYFMNECDTLIYVHAGKSPYVFDQWVDGDMLPVFDALMTGREQPQLFILHTIGSHWYYNSHFTDAFERFTPITRSRIMTSNTAEEMINSYDNTVLYTDYFLHQLIQRLRARNAILFYLSDHGEALGENGHWLHAADTPPMHHPACIVWASPAYQEAHPDKYDALRRNRHQHYRTDFLFPTIVEAAGIRNPAVNTQLSLFR